MQKLNAWLQLKPKMTHPPSMHIVLLKHKFVNPHLLVSINSSTFTSPHIHAVLKQDKILYKIIGYKGSAKKNPNLSYCKKKISGQTVIQPGYSAPRFRQRSFLFSVFLHRYPPADSKASHSNRQSSAVSSNSILNPIARAAALEAQPCR